MDVIGWGALFCLPESTVSEGCALGGKAKTPTVTGRVSTDFTYLPARGRRAGEEIHQVAPRREDVREFSVLGKEGLL